MSLTGLNGSPVLNWGDVKEDTPVAAIGGAAAQPPAGAQGQGQTAAASSNAPPPQQQQKAAAKHAAPAWALPATAPAAAPVAAATAAPSPAASPAATSASPSPAAAPSASTSPSPAAAGGNVDAVAQDLSKTTLATPSDKEEDDSIQISAYSGLHPNDKTAEVTVTGPSDDAAEGSSAATTPASPTIYKAVTSFEALGLSKELLSGVYAMKFTAPSKIQAQALPIILAPNHPNLIGQAHHGSGKTAAFSLGVLSRVDVSRRVPQALILCPTRELAIQVADVLKQLAAYTAVEVVTAVPTHPPRKEKIVGHVVVGTPGTVDAKIAHRELDVRHIQMFVADEADQMIAAEGLGDKTVVIKKRLPRSTQILLFSATFDQATRKFSRVVAPKAVEIMVKTEELSLDGIRQYFMDCKDEMDKYKALTEIFSLLEIGQSIIFVHTVATAKLLANRMRADGYTVSLLHGKDMQPVERDRVMADFRSNKTSVLITTNVLARGIDVLSVTLVINFDVPLTRHGKPDPETYIHRIGRSGRFGRKGVAINFVHDDVSRKQLAAIANHFQKNIVALPRDDVEKISELIQKDLK